MTTASTVRSSRAGSAGCAPKLPLKSPLAVHGEFRVPAAIGVADTGLRAVQAVALTDRAATLAEFEDHLRTTNSRDGRPYEEATINAYVSPGKTLDESQPSIIRQQPVEIGAAPPGPQVAHQAAQQAAPPPPAAPTSPRRARWQG
jgi:hypothetical protein